ncbi:MAG: NAD-dependent succinate-semialdehyde dehydrogenase [Melioribacteraceae bacterium]|nr:NAD-dependent succinate-semialdehyde dehydrogenase [Melioribacteraceae bacterium]
MPIQTINPASGKIEKTYMEFSKDEVKKSIDDAHEAFLVWRNIGFAERSRLMKNVAAVMRNKREEYAYIITTEMGKPIKQSIAEVEKCAWVCDYFAENAEVMLKNEFIKTDASDSYVEFNPLGIILAVMPWNFPFWQVFRFAAPSLMAGNVGLLKHSSNVPMCALAIEQIFHNAGFPKNVFTTLLIGSGPIKEIIKDVRVKAATLTGSEPAGRKIGEACGKELKKSVLELGGSDPFIVFEDANIDEAAKTAVTARLINNGQSCIASKRFIVVEKIYDEFKLKFINAMEKIKVGDPMDESTELGPIAREDLLYELDSQVKDSVGKGAKILTGGKILPGRGFYYAPTILDNLSKGMPAYDDEIFGPVASLIKAQDEEDAIRIANDSPFGLGASLWTADMEKAKLFATKIDAGAIFVNGMVKSDPRLPFGGIKNSGYGRELSHYGIKEFVNIKSVWIK